jgi:hypothetical protein
MTLTEAAFWTKRFGVIALGGFVIFTIVVLIITMSDRGQVAMPEYLTPNYACTLKREEFLEHVLDIPSLQLAENSEMSFDIRTDTGKIGALPQIINVYKFNNPTQSLTAQADAKILARAMGFEPEDIERVATEGYRWVDRSKGRTLDIQAKNMNFTLKTDTSVMRESSREGTLPSEQEAKSRAVNALNSLGVYSPDYSGGNHKTTLVNVNPDGTFRKAASLVDADLIKVDFIRSKSMITIPSNIEDADGMVRDFSRRTLIQPIEETIVINDQRRTVYTFNTLVSFSETQRSNISVYIGPDIEGVSGRMASVYQIDYTYWPIEAESCGTYQLIDPELAIERVQRGQGSLVYLYGTDGDDVAGYMPRVVRKFVVLDVFIVYYEDREESEYLQPVYLVTGEATFDDGTKGTFDYFYPAINYDIVQNRIDLPKPETVDEGGSGIMF